MLVVDACVLTKAIVREQDSEKAMRLLAGRSDLVAPAHCLAEVGEATARKIRNGEAEVAQLEAALLGVVASLRFVPVDRLMLAAVLMSRETNASVYDSLYVALAAAEDCQLVTADTRLIAKMAGTGFAGLLLPLNSFNPAP